jgi:hypothetical protein
MKSAEREHAGVSCGASCANRFVPLGAARWKAQAIIEISARLAVQWFPVPK